ncbi:MAG: DUF378 domain-containing protein [Candidatus Parcubacteria bacterium]|nr:DUF378 domain-containing protein [Candidatus Parcubacteria bacterium]
MKLHGITFILTVIGGLNWGLIALGNWMDSNWNVVNLLVGSWPTVENIVYLLVGLSALVLLVGHKKDCRTCGNSASAPGMGM